MVKKPEKEQQKEKGKFRNEISQVLYNSPNMKNENIDNWLKLGILKFQKYMMINFWVYTPYPKHKAQLKTQNTEFSK